MVTKYSRKFALRICARFRCSKSESTTDLPVIAFFLQRIECLYLAFSEKKEPKKED